MNEQTGSQRHTNFAAAILGAFVLIVVATSQAVPVLSRNSCAGKTFGRQSLCRR